MQICKYNYAVYSVMICKVSNRWTFHQVWLFYIFQLWLEPGAKLSCQVLHNTGNCEVSSNWHHIASAAVQKNIKK